MAADHDVAVLNGLIKTSLDSMKGFEDAAEDAESTRYAQMFAEFARDRGQVASSLQGEVRRLGGDPEDGSSWMGAAHRTFMDLRQAFVGKDDAAIILEVERGEDFIKSRFDAALADTSLLPSARGAVQDSYVSVRQGHDRASVLKHSLS